MGRKVMIVDDNPHIRQALCELFTREGDFDVCGEAENGREAIEKAQQLHPDLIVTDPVMNGLEETRVLKKIMPTIPVIIFTAHDDSFAEKEARAAGVSAVVPKSQAVAVLIWQARSLLDQSGRHSCTSSRSNLSLLERDGWRNLRRALASI
jgi:DNA-binding NarL/FixJ family response regulator